MNNLHASTLPIHVSIDCVQGKHMVRLLSVAEAEKWGKAVLSI